MAQPKAAAMPMPGADIAAEHDGLAATAPPARAPMVVIGHRGSGMNALASPDERLRGDVRENTLRSFNAAARHPAVAYVEFDVQVTKDGCPVIFHDNFIYTEQDGEISGRRVTDLRLDEFLSYGPQRRGHHGGTAAGGKPLLRKLKDGQILRWDARCEDALCTLSEALESVDRRVGFNVELKFDDDLAYTDEGLAAALRAVLDVVSDHAGDGRPIIFSSFHPDAARLLRELQGEYPVYFLTNGGTQAYADPRRNSLEEAVRLCADAGLQGVVSEVRAVLRRPEAVAKIKEAGLALMTYGQLNNVPEVVYVQHLMGVDGVIVDLVREIADAVSAFATAVQDSSPGSVDEDGGVIEGEAALQAAMAAAAPGTPSFSPREMSFLLRLIPELVQQRLLAWGDVGFLPGPRIDSL